MDNPKQRYPLSVANRLRPHPCPACRRKSWPLPDRAVGNSTELDPEVTVAWYCPDKLCNKSTGFWIETQ